MRRRVGRRPSRHNHVGERPGVLVESLSILWAAATTADRTTAWLRAASRSNSSYTDGAQLVFHFGTRGGSTARGQSVRRADFACGDTRGAGSSVLLRAPIVVPATQARDSAHSWSASSSHRAWPPASSSGRHRGSARLRVVRCLGWLDRRGGRRAFGVRVEAAFDQPYNLRLHPTHGARSRVPSCSRALVLS